VAKRRKTPRKMNDIKNSYNFKLKSTKISKIPNSPLLCIGTAFRDNQYYAAAVDPATKKNYVLHANISQQGAGFAATYKDIEDAEEHRAISDFFLKAGVYELYYKGSNWIFPIKPVPAKVPGTKTDSDGRMNINEPMGEEMIPAWFRGKYLKD